MVTGSKALVRLRSGILVDLLNPTIEDIHTGDIVHALSNLCRFNGHTNQFYSVADHSVRVSRIVPNDQALCALLHDATEAYLGDVVSPLKQCLPEYQVIERKWWVAIACRYGLPIEIPQEIKEADRALCWAEMRDLMNDAVVEHSDLPTVLPLDAWESKRAFLARLKELWNPPENSSEKP